MNQNKRLDYPDALHHVLARGVNKGAIFNDARDYERFLKKLREILLVTDTKCYAWALMPNHIHLLLRRTKSPISYVMHRILTSYATYFNKRHDRVGHLFQNRFKSILCQDDDYFLTLVKYIHLNPLKANIVKSLDELEMFPWAGHQAQVGRADFDWQQVNAVLKAFSDNRNQAIKKYRYFMSTNLSEKEELEMKRGRMANLRNNKWELSSTLTSKQIQRANELILGDEYFIRKVIAYNKKINICKDDGKFDLNFQKMIKIAAELCDSEVLHVFSKYRNHNASNARSLICSWCLDELNLPSREIAVQLNMARNAVYAVAAKGRILIEKNSSLAFAIAYSDNG